MREPLVEISANRAPGEELSKETRAAIITAAAAEKSKVEIAKAFGCTRSTVYETLRRFSQHNNNASRPRSGRPQALYRYEKRSLLRLIRSRPKYTYD